jgi:hypothetical protein
MMARVRSHWTAIAVGAWMALGALAAPVNASQRVVKSADIAFVGTLTIAWQGDQARGCAAAGLCGVQGSIEMLADSSGPSGPGQPTFELNDAFSAARVIERSATGEIEDACTDLVPVDLYLDVRRSSAGQLRAIPDREFTVEPPSAGRCAGPTFRDLRALVLPARKVGRYGYDLSGQTTFGAGPFTVTATSTLRALVDGVGISISGSSSGGVIPIGGPPRAHRLFEEHADAVYRIADIAGALTTRFSGLAAPLCDALGACGSSGGLSDTLSAAGTVSFSGSRTVRHPVGEVAALADLRAGRLPLEVDLPELTATLSELVTWPDGTMCTDHNAPMAVSLGFSLFGLTLIPGLTDAGPGTGDPLRTRCPGPSAADILDGSPLATVTVPMSELGAPQLAVTFSGDGSFTASDYSGERGGSVVFSLVLEHASGGTSRVRAFAPIRTGR